jgi:integrase
VNGAEHKVSLGRVGRIGYDDARDEAERLLEGAAKGIAPVAEKDAAEVDSGPVVISLRSVMVEYLADRKRLKSRTKDDYQKQLVRDVPDWLDMPMAEITPEMVRDRHAELGKSSPAGADYTFRVVRLLFNHAMEIHDTEVVRNPVRRLSAIRAWYKVPRRKTVVAPGQLAEFFRVLRLHPGKWADYMEALLFTGVRSASEIAAIPVRNVDLEGRTMLLVDTKNGQDLLVPISKSAATVFERRVKEAKAVGSEFVFYALGSEKGYIGKGGKQIEEVKGWFKGTSLEGFTPHDLRRTFLTICDEVGLSQVVQKRLVGHAISQDVTDGYKVLTMERLRREVAKVERFILKWEKQGPG